MGDGQDKFGNLDAAMAALNQQQGMSQNLGALAARDLQQQAAHRQTEERTVKKTVIKLVIPDGIDVSDGYHTFGELYEHRIELWIALCRRVNADPYLDVWRSKVHADGTSIAGWFVLGIGMKRGEQLTYHLPMSRWDDTDFAQELDMAPRFDGHTSADVLARLRKL